MLRTNKYFLSGFYAKKNFVIGQAAGLNKPVPFSYGVTITGIENDTTADDICTTARKLAIVTLEKDLNEKIEGKDVIITNMSLIDSFEEGNA